MVRRQQSRLLRLDTFQNNIHEAWGFVYDLDNDLPNFYISDEKGTFWLTRKGKLYQKNNAPFVEHIQNNKLFKLKQEQLEQTQDITITIEPMSDECRVNGKKITKKTEVENGQCDITSTRFKHLRLRFEAFLDMKQHPELAKIGLKYRYVNLVGKGGFANVYKGLNVFEETCFAIKTARYTDLDPELEREEYFLAKIQCINVITVIDWIHEGKSKFLVTELGTGGSLDYRMKNGEAISEAFAKRIFVQVFSAFAYLHPKKILHRDMKPANILLMKPNDFCLVKVIDFGLSCFVSEIGEMEYIVGSFEYMAPEILTKKLKKSNTPYTDKTDIWGIGLCIFMALQNCLPIPFDKNLKIYRQNMMQGKENFVQMEEYQNLGKTTKFIIENCLQVNEKNRPTIQNLIKLPWITPEQPEISVSK